MIIFIEFMRFNIGQEYINLLIEALYKKNNTMTKKEKLLNKIDCNTNISIFTNILDSVKLEQNNINTLINNLKIKKEKILCLSNKKIEILNYLKENEELISNFINDQWINIKDGHIVKYTINRFILKINKLYDIQLLIPMLHFYIDYMSINFIPLCI